MKGTHHPGVLPAEPHARAYHRPVGGNPGDEVEFDRGLRVMLYAAAVGAGEPIGYKVTERSLR